MSWIAKNLKPEVGGGFIDTTGCSWDESISAIAIGVLGFCGCGDNESALLRVRGALHLVQRYGDRTVPHAEYRAEKDAYFFGDRGTEYLMWYLLDDKGLTEHGIGEPGWLTEKGKDVLVDLDEWVRGAEDTTT